MTDKVIKALEGLKSLRLSAINDGHSIRRDKIGACVQLAHQISSLRLSGQSMPELTVKAIDSLLHLCDDSDSDVRNVADESLNRVIRVLSETNPLPVQVELYNQIKKNGPARCVRLALLKFASLAVRTRPSKCRGFAAHLTPCLLALATRTEENIHETLAKALERIWPVLGPFSKDNETKDLMKAFIQNLFSENAVIRRSSASSLSLIVTHSRKCSIFTSLGLNWLVDKIVPVSNETSMHLLLGVFNAFRYLLPLTLDKTSNNSNFTERHIQIYELCLHYASGRDHNIITTSLETLNQLLSNCTEQFRLAVVQPGGITKSSIHFTRQPSRLWARSGSEVSVAASTIAGDESLLDDCDAPFLSLNISEQTAMSLNRLRSLSSSVADESFDSDPESICGSIQSLSLGLKDDIAPNKTVDLEETIQSCEDFASLVCVEFERELDVGCFTDQSLPLLFCCRRLSSFLLDGTPGSLRSDRSTRVSVKSIAMSCLSSVLEICPQLFSVKLTPYSDCEQRVSDVLLLGQHSDPMLRGAACVVIGSFIGSSLVESRGRSVAVLDDSSGPLSLQNLLRILDKGLKDSCVTTSRLAIMGVKNCLERLLKSDYGVQTIPLLKSLPSLSSNSYWLNKVRLVELLCSLDFLAIGDVTSNSSFQNDVVDNVLLPLLKDEDGKVRRSAAEGLTRIIPELWTSGTPLTAYTGKFVDHICELFVKTEADYTSLNLPLPYSLLQTEQKVVPRVAASLSRIVAKLTMETLVVDDKYFMYGLVEALRLLSESYPPVIYTRSWQCCRHADAGVCCLLPLLTSHVATCTYFTDLPALENVTVLIGNLYAGNALCALKTGGQVNQFARWSVFGNDEITRVSEDLLTHFLTILNIYTQLLQEPPVVRGPQGRILQMLPKKQEKDDSIHLMSPHYAKIQLLLKNALANHKMCIDDSSNEKLLSVLSATQNALSILLEVCLPVDSTNLAPEILSYARAVVSLQPVPSISLVLQVLRSLFAVNLPHYWRGVKEFVCQSEAGLKDVGSQSEESSKDHESQSGESFYNNVFQIPDDLISERVKNQSIKRNVSHTRLLNFSPDRTVLEHSVRLFEPMVVKSLQLYTLTSDVKLQCIVLTLLTQLVQVKVNYCLLDAQHTFHNFVKKQFELIERGQMGHVDELLPRIFKFFICLSYEKKDSKPLMSTPDILQLFVGLMASDQDKETHCVPGLLPVVKDVFTTRPLVGEDRKEAETQKEVILATLLRLATHRKVFEALHFVVQSEELIGAQVVATVLPLMANRKIRLEEPKTRHALGTLLSSLSPSVFNGTDAVLRTMFLEPPDRNQDETEMARWLAAEGLLLEILLRLKENAVLSRIKNLVHPVDLSAFLSPPAMVADPLLVNPPSVATPPVQSLARLILLALSRSAVMISENLEGDLVENALSGMFVAVFRMLLSGAYHQTTNCLQSLLQSNEKTTSGISAVFVQLSSTHPLLTCQYLYLLGLLGSPDPRVWSPALTQGSSFPLRLVQRGAVLALADYLCENIWDLESLDLLLCNMDVVLEMYDEAPVKELLTGGAARTSAGPPLLQSLSTLNLSSSVRVEKALKILKEIHDDHTGGVIKLLATKFLRCPMVSLTRQTSALACRRIEYLMTLPPDNILQILPLESYREVRVCVEDGRTGQRNAALMVLINKLAKTVYHEPELSMVFEKVSLPQSYNSFSEKWFLEQIKERCCGVEPPGRDMGKLLMKISVPLLQELFAQQDFQVSVLGDCFHAVRSTVDGSRGKLIRDDIPLYLTSREALLNRVRAIVSGLSGPDIEPDPVWLLCPVLTTFLETQTFLSPSGLCDEEMGVVVEFSMHCLLRIAGAINSTQASPSPSKIKTALSCIATLLDKEEAQQWLSQSQHSSVAGSALRACVTIVDALVPHLKTLVDVENSVVFLMEFLLATKLDLPMYLEVVLRRVAVLFCRLPQYWSLAVAVPEACDVEAETLQQLTQRVTLVGWTSRAQFEEVWAALLGGFSIEHADASVATQASIASLEGISVLMQGTLLVRLGDPCSVIYESSRDLPILRECAVAMPRLDNGDGFDRDLEGLAYSKYSHRPGLLSVEHLWSAAQLAAPSPDADSAELTGRRQISALGLDLTSCIRFLLDLFAEWTTEATNEYLLASALKTSLVLSDQFTDPSQFRSLLDVALAIDFSLNPSGLPLLPLCILVTAKCVAALLPGGDDYGRLKDMICRSNAPHVRIATIQALLYVVQSPEVYWRLQPSRHLGNSMFYVEDNAAVTQLVATFLPLAVEILLQFVVDRLSWSEMYEVHAWSLMSYLLLHYRQELGDHQQEFLTAMLAALSANTSSYCSQNVILHAVERLLLADCLDGSHVNIITSAAQNLIGQPQIQARRHGYQLLLTSSFISKRRVKIGPMVPDSLMEAIMRIDLLLKRLKTSAPAEASLTVTTLSYLLRDLQPIDIHSRLIQEFMAPQHPYSNLLAGLLFQIMEDADSLLHDWVVFSLQSLVHGVNTSTGVRTLTCLFLSASRDPWLRAAFPLTQIKTRGGELDNCQLLVEAAAHFYYQLKLPKQQEEFRTVFQTASQITPAYSKILSSISS